jgi:Transposase domain (DUF772)
MMFKILVIQAQNNLSDDRAEFLINDRLSFMRFLGLGLTDRVPDAKTIRPFRERLTKAGAIEALSSALTWRSARQATSRWWRPLTPRIRQELAKTSGLGHNRSVEARVPPDT